MRQGVMTTRTQGDGDVPHPSLQRRHVAFAHTAGEAFPGPQGLLKCYSATGGLTAVDICRLRSYLACLPCHRHAHLGEKLNMVFLTSLLSVSLPFHVDGCGTGI